MKRSTVLFTAFAVALLTLGGCTQTDGSDDATTPSDGGAATQSSSTLPSALFASEAPSDAPTLINVKQNAAVGDTVTFEARIGGRHQPFVDGRAMFFVTDPSILSCDQLHGDTCPTPWDYCCEPKDNLMKHMATVQVVDGAGQPVKQSLADEHGLKPLRTVFVTGQVQHVDEAGNFTVNAESIHVKEG